jgi:hypothetical protein
MRALVSILMLAYNAEEWVGAGICLGLWRNLAPERDRLSSITALLTLAGVRQFESNEVRVATQPNQGAAALVFDQLVTKRIRTN